MPSRRSSGHAVYVLLLEVRGFHCGYLGCYGNQWIDTPHFDRLASQGVIYDYHYVNWIGAGHAPPSWQSGQRGPLLKARFPLPLDRGLETKGVVTRWLGKWGSEGAAISLNERGINDIVNSFTRAPPVLIAVGLDDLHPPWIDDGEDANTGRQNVSTRADNDPEKLQESDEAAMQIRASYTAGVETLDQGFGELIDLLKKRGLLDEIHIVVTSDRGVSLGEHTGALEIPVHPYEEISHLPLIMRLPRSRFAGHRVHGLTQPHDLLPTMSSWFGATSSESVGVDLLRWCGEDMVSERAAVCIGLEAAPNQPSWGLRTDEWACFMPGDVERAELYRKPEDRWEVNNVVHHYSELVPRLIEELSRIQPGA